MFHLDDQQKAFYQHKLLYNMGVTLSGCWEWTKGRDGHGYGQISVGSAMISAPRISYAAFVGDIPTGLCVCHRCDHPACVNPDHLFLGTAYDNIQDKVAKGRQSTARGERHPNAKFTNEGAEIVRQEYKSGINSTVLAKKYGVSHMVIMRIVHNKSYRKEPE